MVTISINYDFKTVDAVIYWLDSLYVKYNVPFGYRTALENLACSKITEIESSKSKVIENILKNEGIEYSIAAL